MRRALPPILLGVAAALSLGAADPGRDGPPASPAFQRPSDALFADDFSGPRLKGWRSDGAIDTWSVRDGMLRAELPDVKQAHSFLYAGDASWTDYAVEFDVCGMRGVDKGVAVRVRGKKALAVDLRGAHYQDVVLYIGEIPVGSARVENRNGAWYHVRVEIHDNACRVSVGGQVVFDKRLRFKAPPRGGIALSAYTGGAGQCTVYYDNVVVTRLAARGAN